MPDFFDFLGQVQGPGVTDTPDYFRRYTPHNIRKMNWRYRHIVQPIKDELDGATVLDLGSHDGRWPYALAAAGATVTGIEGRGDLIEQFSRFPEDEARSRVSLVEGDFIAEMDRLLAEGSRFDVVTCLGVFYHTIQHYRILMQMVAFRPKIIVVDSVFHLANRAMIGVASENTTSHLNSIAQTEGQTEAPIGRISRSAFELMVDTLGYRVEWNDWQVPEEERTAVMSYFNHPRNKHLRRFTCFLRPA